MFSIAAEPCDKDNFENVMEVTGSLNSYLNTLKKKHLCLRDHKEIAIEILVSKLLTFNSLKFSRCMD